MGEYIRSCIEDLTNKNGAQPGTTWEQLRAFQSIQLKVIGIGVHSITYKVERLRHRQAKFSQNKGVVGEDAEPSVNSVIKSFFGALQQVDHLDEKKETKVSTKSNLLKCLKDKVTAAKALTSRVSQPHGAKRARHESNNNKQDFGYKQQSLQDYFRLTNTRCNNWQRGGLFQVSLTINS